MVKLFKKEDYSEENLRVLGENYIKVCYLILSSIENNDLKDFEQRQMLFPLIYNFRHAAELYLKSLLLKANISFSGTHDLELLLHYHIPELTDYFNNLECPESCKSAFAHFVKDLMLITENYFGKVKIHNEKDSKNSFFRYPERRHSNELAKLNMIDFTELRNQIKELKRNFLLLELSTSVETMWLED